MHYNEFYKENKMNKSMTIKFFKKNFHQKLHQIFVTVFAIQYWLSNDMWGFNLNALSTLHKIKVFTRKIKGTILEKKETILI